MLVTIIVTIETKKKGKEEQREAEDALSMRACISRSSSVICIKNARQVYVHRMQREHGVRARNT